MKKTILSAIVLFLVLSSSAWASEGKIIHDDEFASELDMVTKSHVMQLTALGILPESAITSFRPDEELTKEELSAWVSSWNPAKKGVVSPSKEGTTLQEVYQAYFDEELFSEYADRVPTKKEFASFVVNRLSHPFQEGVTEIKIQRVSEAFIQRSDEEHLVVNGVEYRLHDPLYLENAPEEGETWVGQTMETMWVVEEDGEPVIRWIQFQGGENPNQTSVEERGGEVVEHKEEENHQNLKWYLSSILLLILFSVVLWFVSNKIKKAS